MFKNKSNSVVGVRDNSDISLIKIIFISVALALSGCAELTSLFFIQPLLPKLAATYHVPVSQVSIILSAETGLLALGLLFTGTLCDRWGRKRSIVVSLVLGGILTLLCPIVHSWTVLVILRGLIGFSLCCIAAAASAYISEEVPSILAGMVTGYFVFGNSLGGMSGRVIASQLMNVMSVGQIFFIFSIILLMVALVVGVMLPSSRNFKAENSINLMAVIRGASDHFRNTKVSLMFIVSFVIFGSFTSIYNFFAFYLHRAPFDMPYSKAGLVSICFALSFFTAPMAGRLANKYGSANILTVLLLAMVGGVGLTSVATSSDVFIVGVVIFTAAFFGCHSLGLGWVAKNATHARGQATSFYLFFYYMGGSVVGYINGPVFISFGWAGLSMLIVALLFVGLVATRVLNRRSAGVALPANA